MFNLDEGSGEGNTITVGHGIVRDCGESGDEGSQDVEEAFLLDGDRLALCSPDASQLGGYVRPGRGKPWRKRQWRR